MDINSINISETSNHLSSRLKSLNTKKTTTNDVGNPDPVLGQGYKYGRVKPVVTVEHILSVEIAMAQMR
jgi:hypothetical protein